MHHQNAAQTQHHNHRKRGARTGVLKKALLAALALCFVGAAGYGGYYLSQHANKMYVQINGETYELLNGTTVAGAITETNLPVTPGRLLAVDNSVLDEQGGTGYDISVNGKPAYEQTYLFEGDEVLVQSGQDQTEETSIQMLPVETVVEADDTYGAVHQVVDYDASKQYEARAGAISGIPLEKDGTEIQHARLTKYNINTEEKLIALTFDDGPWPESTAQVLDILKKNDAKATFFVVGTCFEDNQAMSDLVKRAYLEGHQVCTHSYSHAAGKGKSVDMGLMSEEAQIEEVTKGQELIAQATGAPASKVFRAPGGNYSTDTARIVLPYVSFEIGWNIDTNDWRQPGVDAIQEALMSVDPGNIVLMHDGGGDRSQTVEALKKTLPKLKKKGWKFVTIDELLAYR